MSDRTQFWLGSVMLALAFGLLVGGLVLPQPAYSSHTGEGRSGRYALVTGIAGSTRNTETLYVADEVNDILFAFEYSSAAKEVKPRDLFDLRRMATKVTRDRSKRDDRGKLKRP